MRDLERLCTIAGGVALAVCGLAVLAMHHGREVAARAFAAQPVPAVGKGASSGSHVIGQVEIPALRLQAPLTDGVGTLELMEGVGHLPGTAMPGGLGTVALAGHRDTFFRGLRAVAPGMDVRVRAGAETYVYQVDGTRVVSPREVDVLETGAEPALVLITCYPFHFVGPAPRRFVVHARLLSLLPSTL